ncbi:MAG: hypothetical protein ACREQ8_17000 [Woeseiaceae bacterium]
MTAGPSHGEQIAALHRRLEQLAADGEWQQIADAVKDRDALLAELPAAECKQALLAASRCTERLQILAQAAKSQCAQELAKLKRGRQAAASYRSNR